MSTDSGKSSSSGWPHITHVAFGFISDDAPTGLLLSALLRGFTPIMALQ